MKTLLAALALSLSSTSLALAAPGDPVALRGTLAWPAALGSEPFAVVRGDDGRVYYADLSGAQRRDRVAGGDRISLLGIEGSKPHEVAAVAIGAGDSVLAQMPRLDAPAPPATDAVSPAPAPAPSAAPAAPPAQEQPRPTERFEGTLESVADLTIPVKTTAGRTVKVDVSKLGKAVLGAVKPGDRVTVFAVTEPDRTLSAIGFIHAR
jgi:hypothetical protein